ncbi:MAG: DEAD/DEAH box helicase [Actinomycetota bacterium]
MRLFTKKRPTSRWSPSLQWLHKVVTATTDVITSGYVFPSLQHDGLRWRATWSVIQNEEIDQQINTLYSSSPTVLGIKEFDDARDLYEELVDASCRRSLQHTNWKPKLPRTRKTSTRSLRSISGALSDPVGYFVTETIQDDNSLLELSSRLRDTRCKNETSLNLSCQARLEPGNTNEPWNLTFEVFRQDNPSEIIRWDEFLSISNKKSDIFATKNHKSITRFLKEISEAISVSVPGLDQLNSQFIQGKVQLSIDEVSLLLLDGLQICEIIGVPVLVPKGLLQRKVRLAARATATETGGISSNLGTAMVNVDWSVALGDETLSEEDLQTLANSKSNLIQIKGEWVNIDNSQAETALQELERRKKNESHLSPTDLLRITAEIDSEQTEFESVPFAPDLLSPDDWLTKLMEGLPDDRLVEKTESDEFQGELRPYQRRALSWLQFLGRLGLGGCLADDMGLGKTPTTLAHIQSRPSQLPNLVICPLSVVHNWEAEAQIFTPNLKVLVAHGPNRPSGDELIKQSSSMDIVISTYGTTTRDIESLARIQWDLVVCDEAQFIKNHNTHAADAFRRLNAHQKIALTGTPVENRLAELWSILDAINPGMLGGITWFKEKFATPIEQKKDTDALNGMRRLTDPFILRRTKDDKSLVPDLPEKIEQIVWSQLTHEQAALYKAVLNEFLLQAEQTDGMKRKGLILATLTKLKQICNHPAHFLNDGNNLGERSGKVARLDELVQEIIETNQRVLVFTQYRVMGDLLADHLSGLVGRKPDFLHGGITRGRRQKMIDQFQLEDGPPILLISLKAGGTGLNLTAANRVIHFDRWWNPAVEDQATDRAWRIGQQRTVFVHKLVCQGTLEENINNLLVAKRELASQSVGTGDDWFTNMNTDELRQMLSLNMAKAVQE